LIEALKNSMVVVPKKTKKRPNQGKIGSGPSQKKRKVTASKKSKKSKKKKGKRNRSVVPEKENAVNGHTSQKPRKK